MPIASPEGAMVRQTLAPAKVNLFLHVGPVKDNGRHDLSSLVVFADEHAGDRVAAVPAEALSLKVTGPMAGAPALGATEDNLILRAARALAAQAGVSAGAAITLEKHLPVAAGIGGGSADAAATLRLLTDLWGLSGELAQAIAPDLGGDVPVALANCPAIMRGEGEQVERLSAAPPLNALLVNPGVACPTGSVFAAYDAAGSGAGCIETPEGLHFADQSALIDWLSGQRNDLEAAAISCAPVIGDVLAILRQTPRVRLARMSGSGATCFALFETAQDAGDAVEMVGRARPDWWVRQTVLGAGQ